MARAGGENFPVASRLLGRAERAHLLAIYGFARLVDQLGDESSGDRLAALDWLQGELERAFEGRARHPLLVRLQGTIVACALQRGPFERLIEANRLDQRVHEYDSYEQLLAYCALSANPVGELVLAVLAQATPARVALSDSICTALQLTEHWQDVGEDRRNGRVYIPAEDLERFGCAPAELDRPHAGEPLRSVLAFELARTRALFDRGAPLIGELRGRARIAVAAFVGGGRAALAAIERARFDVLAGPPRASSPRRMIAALEALLARGAR